MLMFQERIPAQQQKKQPNKQNKNKQKKTHKKTQWAVITLLQKQKWR